MATRFAFLLLATLPAVAAPPALVFRCRVDNDLFRAVAAGGTRPARYTTAREAVARAPRGAGVLILADEYPDAPTPVDRAIYEEAAKKELRLFVEYPAFAPNLALGEPRRAGWERGVVSSDAFSPALARLRILGLHDISFLTAQVERADIVVARVAGLDTAVYGLPKQDVYPILFEHEGVLVSTTKLSQFVTARYAPSDAWAPVWKRVLAWLAPGSEIPALRWTPVVRPSYSRTGAMPPDAELSAFRRGSGVYGRARLFVHPSWKAALERNGRANDGVAPAPESGWQAGDGSEGVLEGFSSRIFPDGSQPIRWALRADCIGEVSFHMALWGLLDGGAAARAIAGNLNDYLHRSSEMTQGPRADPKSPSFGLIGWTLPTAPGAYYGDDNARSMLGTIGAAAALGTDRWDEPLMRALLANLRTTGRLGFRGNRIDEATLQKNGWRSYFDSEKTNYRPHYEAYLWACYLWAFHKTGIQPFYDRAESAIRKTMAAYPNEWRWTNGMQQERARMLLALSWLVRVRDTREHRDWLRLIARELIAFQDESGAIREELGPAGKGSYGPPRSNDEYGKKEATLIQQNGDPVSDLLYTTNFAFLGLHEAAAATGESSYREASNKLAAFLCRIQVRSEARPELDGWWFRAFDGGRWDYWASNADAGWGAWSTETGWTQAWIASVLAMRHKKTSLWDLTAASKIGARAEALRVVMLPPQ